MLDHSSTLAERSANMLTSTLDRTLETNIGIFCGCLPALKPLVRHLDKEFFSASWFSSLFTRNPPTAGSNKIYPTEDHEYEDHPKRTYRVLVENGDDKRSRKLRFHPQAEDLEKRLPDPPFPVHHVHPDYNTQNERKGGTQQDRSV